MTIIRDELAIWSHGDYALTNSPSMVRDYYFVKCDNYNVSGIANTEFVTGMSWYSDLSFYNNYYSGQDVWMHIKPDLTRSNVASLADMQASVRLYGTHSDKTAGTGTYGGFNVKQMMAQRTSAYVDLTRNLTANNNASSVAGASGNGHFYDITPLIDEMVSQDRSDHYNPQFLGFLIMQDVEQNTGTSSDVAFFHAPINNFSPSDVVEDDSISVFYDQPTNYSLDPASLESDSQCHDAIPAKAGLGDSGATQGLGEDFWFLPRLWKDVDAYTGPNLVTSANSNTVKPHSKTTLMTEMVGKLGLSVTYNPSTGQYEPTEDLSKENSIEMQAYINTNALLADGQTMPEADSDGLYEHNEYGFMYYEGQPTRSLLGEEDEWTISFWEKRPLVTSYNDWQTSGVRYQRILFGDTGRPGSTNHNGWSVSSEMTYNPVGAPSVQFYFGNSRDSLGDNNVQEYRRFSTNYLYHPDVNPGKSGSYPYWYNFGDWNWWVLEKSQANGLELYLNGVKATSDNGTFAEMLNQGTQWSYNAWSSPNIYEEAYNTYFVGSGSRHTSYYFDTSDQEQLYGWEFPGFEGKIDDIRVYRRTLDSRETDVLSTRGRLGSSSLLEVDSVEAHSEVSESRVDRHNLLLVGSEASSLVSSPSLSLSYSADAESAEAQAQNLEAAVPVPVTSDSVQSSSECSQADVARGIGLSADSSQSSSQSQRVNLDLSGAANAESLRVNSECQSVNLDPDRVLEGLGGETSWVSASRDNDNEDTAATEDFVDGNSDLTVQSGQWQDDAGNGGDHAFVTSNEVQISGDLF